MQKIAMILILVCGASITRASAEPNVILITLDGVRYHEIFEGIRKPRMAGEHRGTPIIPDVERIVNSDGFFIGNRPAHDPTMWISNRISLSQPGYRAILSGQFEKTCRGNDCPVIDHETILDRLMDDGFPSRSVAAFSSWDVIGKCIESKTPRAVRSISFEPIKGLTPEEAAPFMDIQAKANLDRPRWKGSRFDHYTFEMGLKYLKEFRPRFLYLAFVEPDEYGHSKDYKGYVGSLRDFNQRFVTLVETLKEMGSYGDDTSIVVTTDHGRGRGFLWQTHGKMLFDSRRVWAIVLPSERIRREQKWEREARNVYFQYDVRPTVEVLLGIPPRDSVNGRGKSLISIGR